MNVEDCVISKILYCNSIKVNMVTFVNNDINCQDIWLLCNIDGTGPLWVLAFSLINFDQCDMTFFTPFYTIIYNIISK